MKQRLPDIVLVLTMIAVLFVGSFLLSTVVFKNQLDYFPVSANKQLSLEFEAKDGAKGVVVVDNKVDLPNKIWNVTGVCRINKVQYPCNVSYPDTVTHTGEWLIPGYVAVRRTPNSLYDFSLELVLVESAGHTSNYKDLR